MPVAPKGIDVRAALGGRLVFRASLKDSAGAELITGATTLSIYELQDDGTLKTYDFADNTFKTGAITTETLAMTVRKGNNNTTDLGLWTVALTTLTGFTVGAIYFAVINNAGASPVQQEREFQFGGAEGDSVVSATGYNQVDVVKVDNAALGAHGVGYLPADMRLIQNSATTANNVTIYFNTQWASVFDLTLNKPNANATHFVGQDLTGNNAILRLKQLNVVNDAGNAIVGFSSGGNGNGAIFTGQGTGGGLRLVAGATGNGVDVVTTNGDGINLAGVAGAGKFGIVGTLSTTLLTTIAAAIWNSLTATYVLANSFGKFFQDMLDAAVSSRMATFVYTAPPTAAQNATQVRAELAVELARIDANISSRMATFVYTSPPTVAQVAAQVRLELAIELARIDANISSRMATFAYTAPDNAGIATLIVGQALQATLANQALQATAANQVIINNNVLQVVAVTNKLDTMLVIVAAGPTYQYTEEALELAPSSGGGSPIGPGASPNVITITSNGIPLADADVWLTLDEAGTQVVAGTLQTNSEGEVTFLLDSGVTYYAWMQKDGENPLIAQEFVAT